MELNILYLILSFLFIVLTATLYGLMLKLNDSIEDIKNKFRELNFEARENQVANKQKLDSIMSILFELLNHKK